MKTTKEEVLKAIKLAVETGVTDREYWHSRTPEERLWAMELMRQRAHGYDEHSAPRLERVIEILTLRDYGSERRDASDSTNPPKKSL
jgi:hypothetical protein